MAFEKKNDQQQPAAQTTNDDLSAQESGEVFSFNSIASLQRTTKENRQKLTPANIIAFQRTVGNRAVQRMIARQSRQIPVSASQPGHSIQRKLISESTRAFDTAELQNPGYSQGRSDTDQFMPESHQKKVIDIRETFGKTGGSASDLKDFIRAYLLSQYAERLAILDAKNDLTEAEKKKKKAIYLSKSLEVRDKHAPLLKMGPAAPETQAFLEEEGFKDGVAVTPGEQKKVLSKGPRVDVRATFIGGKVLGIALRAHLFIVYTSSEGKQVYFRGGPDEDDFTVADMGDYTPGTVDWDPSAPSVTVLKGPAAANKLTDLIEATSVINNMKVPYVAHTNILDGENCNATAWTILKRAGLPTKKPSGIHPGWGNILGSTLKQGNDIEPKTDDLTATGDPALIKKDNAQLYKDQWFTEKDQLVAKDIPVTVLETWGKAIKIRFGDNKIAFIAKKYLKKPKVVLPNGRPFQIAGKPNEIHTILNDTKTALTTYYPLTGDTLEVLDDGFTPGPAWNKEHVMVKFTDGGIEQIGYILGRELRVPQVGKVADQDVKPVVNQPAQPRAFKLAADAMVMDETKAKFVRDYSPKAGENVMVDEPDFNLGDRAWYDRTVKIKYNVGGEDKIGYLLGQDFAIN